MASRIVARIEGETREVGCMPKKVVPIEAIPVHLDRGSKGPVPNVKVPNGKVPSGSEVTDLNRPAGMTEVGIPLKAVLIKAGIRDNMDRGIRPQDDQAAGRATRKGLSNVSTNLGNVLHSQAKKDIGVSLNEVSLNEVCLNGVCLIEVSLNGVCLIEVSLNGVCLNGVCLIGVCLIGVCLIGVCLIEVCLNGVCLNGVCLNGVCHRDVCLREVWPFEVGIAVQRNGESMHDLSGDRDLTGDRGVHTVFPIELKTLGLHMGLHMDLAADDLMDDVVECLKPINALAKKVISGGMIGHRTGEVQGKLQPRLASLKCSRR